MATEPISMAYYINPSHQSVCVCILIYPIIARQRLGIHVGKEYTEQRELLDESLYGPCRITGQSVGLSMYPSTVTRQWFDKHVPATMKNY
jgi:hypothetical protein